MRNPIPTAGTLLSHATVKHVYDKGSGALVVLDSTTKDDKGNEIFFNQCTPSSACLLACSLAAGVCVCNFKPSLYFM